MALARLSDVVLTIVELIGEEVGRVDVVETQRVDADGSHARQVALPDGREPAALGHGRVAAGIGVPVEEVGVIAMGNCLGLARLSVSASGSA